MRNLLVIFLFAFFTPFILPAQTIQFSGPINGSQTWSADTVQITGDVTVNASADLTIDPGTVVEFMDHYRIYVQGRLIARGTPQDTIRFTRTDTTGLRNNQVTDGGWRGILFEYIAAGDSSVLEYCRIEYAKKGLQINTLGAVQCTGSDNVRIAHNRFSDNIFNTWAGGLMLMIASPYVVDNEFAHNKADYGGGIACFTDSHPLILRNYIHHNFALRAAGGIMVQESNPRILLNRICNNSTEASNCGPADGSGAIRITNNSEPYVANNLIANNSTGMNGGGIQVMYGSHAQIVNNTIVNNYAAFYGSGMYFIEARADMRNNIIWGNRKTTWLYDQQIAFWSSDSLTKIFHNCIEGDSANFESFTGNFYAGPYSDNIAVDPQFISASAGVGVAYDGNSADWSLSSGSACTESGTLDSLGANMPSVDLAGAARVAGITIDMGVYEYPLETALEAGLERQDDWTLWPNPSSGRLWLASTEGDNPENVALMDMNGRTLVRPQVRRDAAGFQVDISGQAAGMYILSFESEDRIYHRKLQIQH